MAEVEKQPTLTRDSSGERSYHNLRSHGEYTGAWFPEKRPAEPTQETESPNKATSRHSQGPKGLVANDDSTKTDYGDSPEDNMFDWVIVLPLPDSAEMSPGAFDKLIRSSGLEDPQHFLEQVFQGLLEDGEDQAFRALAASESQQKIDQAFRASKSRHKLDQAFRSLAASDGTQPSLQASEQLLSVSSQASKPLLEHPPLNAVRQTTIELVLASIQALDSAIAEAIGQQSKQGDGAPDLGKFVEVSCFTGSVSAENDSIFVCLRLSRMASEHLAELRQYPLQLHKDSLKTLRPPMKIDDDEDHAPAYTKFRKGIRSKFALFADAHAWQDDSGRSSSVLREIDRLRLLYDVLTDAFDLELLSSVGLISHSFPLHHRKLLRELRDEWANLRRISTFDQPDTIKQIRRYFGEEIAHYFSFLGCLTRTVVYQLLIPGVISQCVATYCWYTRRDSGVYYNRFFMAMWIMIWYRGFTLKWFQLQTEYIEMWGIDQHKSNGLKRVLNSRVKGKYKTSKIDENKRERTVDGKEKCVGRICAFLLTIIFSTCLIVLLAWEHYAFFQVSKSHQIAGRDLSEGMVRLLPMALGVGTGIQIKVVDSLWDALGDRVVDLESRTYRDQFEDSKRVKAVFVKFLTTMSTMFFFAFVQPMLELEHNFDTHWRIQMVQQMMTTFVVRFIVLGSLMNHLVQPLFNLYRKAGMGAKKTSYIEFQTVKERYGSNDLTNNYLDVLLPFCFVIFFGAVVPGCVVLFVVLLMVAARSDAIALTHVFQRPFPKLRSVAGLKQFQNFLEAGGHLMIVTKMGLLFFELGGVVQLDIPFLANESKLPLAACNMTEWDPIVNRTDPMGDQEWTCLLISHLVNLLFFLLSTLVFMGLWHVTGYWVDRESRHTRIERYRHDQQRHRLITTHQLQLPMLDVEPSRGHADFSKLRSWANEETILSAADEPAFVPRILGGKDV